MQYTFNIGYLSLIRAAFHNTHDILVSLIHHASSNYRVRKADRIIPWTCANYHRSTWWLSHSRTGHSLHCTVLHCAALPALHCTALHCTAIHCTTLFCIVLHCLHCTLLFCNLLHSIALHLYSPYCTLLQCCVITLPDQRRVMV